MRIVLVSSVTDESKEPTEFLEPFIEFFGAILAVVFRWLIDTNAFVGIVVGNVIEPTDDVVDGARCSAATATFGVRQQMFVVVPKHSLGTTNVQRMILESWNLWA